MTQMENRIVLTRFKDGYGPVGAYFLHLKTYTQNAYGEEYESTLVRQRCKEKRRRLRRSAPGADLPAQPRASRGDRRPAAAPSAW